MILRPVIERELRVAARTRQTYRNRFFAALGMIAVLLFILWESRSSNQARLGSETFSFLTFTALVLSLLAGFFHTADCISEERREGTLGLLFLTDLRSLHVVVGKLFARSIPALFALTTVVPVLALPFLLGGVTPGELQRVALVLLNALWLSLAAGVFASTLAKDDRATLILTFVLILLPTAIAPMLGDKRWSAFWIWDAATRDNVYGGRKADFWLGMLFQSLLPCLYVIMAAARARAIWRENPPNAVGEKARARWREWLSGSAAQRNAWRRSMLDENPALWLACRRRERTALLWSVLAVGLLWLVWIWFSEHRIEPLVSMFGSVCFHWILKITIAFAAARAIADEARSGAFELLFTTHLNPGRLIRGHLAGLVRSFGPPLALVIAFDIFFITVGRTDGLFVREFMWARIAVLLMDVLTIAVFGIWAGYRLKRSGKAAVLTLLLVIVLPNFAWMIIMAGRNSFVPIFMIWFAVDAVLIAIAVRNLKQLRARSAERFLPSSGQG